MLGAAAHARQATGLRQHACMQADVMTLSIEQDPALEESLEAQSCSLSHDSGRVVASEHNGLDTFKPISPAQSQSTVKALTATPPPRAQGATQ